MLHKVKRLAVVATVFDLMNTAPDESTNVFVEFEGIIAKLPPVGSTAILELNGRN